MQKTQPFRRINIFGGPGAGKSTTAAAIYQHASRAGLQVEFVKEFFKLEAYLRAETKPFQQFEIMGQQMRQERIPLQYHPTVVVISESPIQLSAYYATWYKLPEADELRAMALRYESVFPSHNIYLQRPDSALYQTHGRLQTEQESRTFDRTLKAFLDDMGVTYEVWSPADLDALCAHVTETIRTR